MNQTKFKIKAAKIFCLLVMILFFTGSIYSQETFSVKSSADESYIYVDSNGKVSIDTSTTLGTLTVNGNDGIIATGTIGSGTASNLGAGTRMASWETIPPPTATFRWISPLRACLRERP